MIMFIVLENEFGYVYGEMIVLLINFLDNCMVCVFVGLLSKWCG